MDMIRAEHLTYSHDFPGGRHPVLEDLSLSVQPGDFLVILGPNGCGKTTLARLFNALLPLQGGELTVAGLNVREESCLWQIRKACGMVFQSPDNQFVSSVVEEDLAFGPRNFGTAEEEIPHRIAQALETVGLPGFQKRSPQLLSGGQKQRLAIAGVLAAEPEILILDEVTAMLDPAGRRDVLSAVHHLHQLGKTIVMISHYVEEAVQADKVAIMYHGQILACGSPRELLTNTSLLQKAGLMPPMAVQLYHDLYAAGIQMDHCPLDLKELGVLLCP